MASETLSHTSETTEHVGPHILSTKGDHIDGWMIGDFPITTTIFSTWIFMGVLFLTLSLFYAAVRSDSLPRIRAIGIDITKRLYDYTYSLLGQKGATHQYLWLLGGIFVVVFFGNIFGLVLDWFNLIAPSLHSYFRPIYSDLATTLVLSLSVILIAQISGIMKKGFFSQYGHYLFNYHGHGTAEKVVNVFVGWLHFFGEFIRIGSLSMRLFLNILVGAILISIAVYIGNQIPSFHTGIFQMLALPFWFFELLVAFLQAYIFMTLSALYIRESFPENHTHHTLEIPER